MTKKSTEKLSASETGIDEEEIVIDPAWPHL